MPKPAPETRLADAALKLLAKTPWQELTLASVARAARVPLQDLQPIASSKSALLGLILRRTGGQVAARYAREPGTAHDRLFEAAMCWFDVLTPHKKAVGAIYEGLRCDPVMLIAARDGIFEAANWLMTLAEADAGPAPPLRALGFAAAIASTIPAWLDDGADTAKTMAALDKGLRRGDAILKRAHGPRAGQKKKPGKKKKTNPGAE